MAKTQLLTPRKTLNKAYLKVKPNRSDIERFKKQLALLLDHVNENESEEFHKNLLADFLKNTWYANRFFINTKGREDLAIYNGKDAKSSVGVIIETKKPANHAEMPSHGNLNCKAFQELVLYYMRERITGNNLEIKQLIATNLYEWYIFDALVFEKLFAKNKAFVKQFTDFEEKRLSGTNTDFFYKEIAAPFIHNLTDEVYYTYFDLGSIEKNSKGQFHENDVKLIPYYKIFSPEHLLKLPFSNDSNSLDRSFYNELLHIIGLEESKEGSKKVIGRKAEGKRNEGSLIENTMKILLYDDCLGNIKRSEYGATRDEQLYNVALELVITWINRVLFLKLLEGQLVRYHNGDANYRFLNASLIPDFDALNKLFFQVLAIKEEERNELVKHKFARIPYLNSSLFEPNELEHKTIRISNLENEYALPLLPQTVLKDRNGKRLTGSKNTLEYMFGFLDAYDFSNESSEEIQEENKTLINASVLGLIFEKINGYKDGSFFTPGFITMYMCRETIRRAVVQKFNEAINYRRLQPTDSKQPLNPVFSPIEFKTLDDVYNAIGAHFTREEANSIINSLKICDPAVGSGHFLVSALNELIAIKSELKILMDKHGKILRDYHVEVANDELMVTDIDGRLFEYRPASPESQRVQETLFHEKQTLIENCLFGVDINPNSVKICRLRLWIELLKNAYYLTPVPSPQGKGTGARLETLPNIDINIKCGNSLISRYALDADIKKALKNSRWNIDSYKMAVQNYREAKSKEVKHEMQRLIDSIKNDFESEIAANDKRLLKLNKLKGELFAHSNQQGLFELSKTEQKAFNDKADKLNKQIKALDAELEEIRNNAIYDNAFEWRFEFPEVLNNDGGFTGFDVVIGNPPYINFSNLDNISRNYFKSNSLFKNKTDLYAFFIGLSYNIRNSGGFITLIVPHTWISTTSFLPLRKLLFHNREVFSLVELNFGVFKDAYVKTVILQIDNIINEFIQLKNEDFSLKQELPYNFIEDDSELKINLTWNPQKQLIFKKIIQDSKKLQDILHFSRGIKTSDDNRFIHKECKNEEEYFKVLRGRNIKAFKIDFEGEFIWYRPDLMKEKVGSLPHTKDVFEASEKLITQRVNSSGQLLATYDNEQYFCLDTTNVSTAVYDSSFNLKYILGIINSKLINWWFNDLFKNPTISGYELHQIPIKKEKFIESKIVILVNQILAQKSANPAADTSALEAEIDVLVYKLYGLTWEEVKIVDPGFGMSEEEYTKFS